MKTIMALVIGCTLGLAGAVIAQQTETQESPAAKKGGKAAKQEQATQGAGANEATGGAETQRGGGKRGRGAKAETNANATGGVSSEQGTTGADQGMGKGRGKGRGAKAETSGAMGASGANASTETGTTTETGAGMGKGKGKGKGRGAKANADMNANAGATGTGANAGASASVAPNATGATTTADQTTQTGGKKGKRGKAAAAASAQPSASIAATGAAGASGSTGAVTGATAAPTASVAAATNAATTTNATATTGGNAQITEKNVGRGGKRVEQQKVQQIKQQHVSFKAQPKPNVAPAVTFNQSYRIQNAHTWQGPQYEVYRSYQPQWHDRGWYHSHYPRVELIAGGYYFFNNGYWYPAWGYDQGNAYYAYDAPIYVGHRAEPPDRVIADVQAELQDMGYYTGEVDGLLGPLTRQALRDYQADHGLYVTEVIDEPTLDALQLG